MVDISNSADPKSSYNPKGYAEKPYVSLRYKKIGEMQSTARKLYRIGKTKLTHVVASDDRKDAVMKTTNYGKASLDIPPGSFNEARTLMKMPHPNIVRCKDVFTNKGEFSMTYEMC